VPDLPKIAELFSDDPSSVASRLRPFAERAFSSGAEQNEGVQRYRSAQKFGSDARTKCDALEAAIDSMAEKVTVDREHFHLKSPSYPSG